MVDKKRTNNDVDKKRKEIIENRDKEDTQQWKKRIQDDILERNVEKPRKVGNQEESLVSTGLRKKGSNKVKSSIVNYDNLPFFYGNVKKGKEPVRCRITSTRNNTKVVRTWYDNQSGKRVNYVKTAGCRGYKNAKRGTLYAAQERGAYVAKNCKKETDGKGIHLYRRGIGVGRISVLKELEKGGWIIQTVSDATKDAHNGCRRKKRRRI